MDKNDQKKSLCIFSYNSRGFTEDKQKVCKMLCAENREYHAILCNQEHFLLRNNCYKIRQCLPDYQIFPKPATKDSLEGRPRIGMFIAVPKVLSNSVVDVSPSHKRIQAITINCNGNKILVVNSYFPTDPRLKDFDKTDLISTLVGINDVILENDCSSVIWGGDINADFARKTEFTKLVNDFTVEKSLLKSWDTYDVDFTHCFEINDNSYTSRIDHFFYNESLLDRIDDAGVLHLLDNKSDHCPIYCRFQIETTGVVEKEYDARKNRMPIWRRATEEQKESFKQSLTDKLLNITISHDLEYCNDVNCRNEGHLLELDGYLSDLLEAVEMVSSTLITPIVERKKKKKGNPPIFNWKEEVAPHKDTAMFWPRSRSRPMSNSS